MGSTEGLCVPWKPGQSGNPRGGSAKASRKKRLREAMESILASCPPEALMDRIPPGIRETLPGGITFAELIALRVAMIAASAEKPETVLSAGQLILNAQEKGAPPPPAPRRPPILPSTEERRRAVAEQLGIDLTKINDR